MSEENNMPQEPSQDQGSSPMEPDSSSGSKTCLPQEPVSAGAQGRPGAGDPSGAPQPGAPATGTPQPGAAPGQEVPPQPAGQQPSGQPPFPGAGQNPQQPSAQPPYGQQQPSGQQPYGQQPFPGAASNAQPPYGQPPFPGAAPNAQQPYAQQPYAQQPYPQQAGAPAQVQKTSNGKVAIIVIIVVVAVVLLCVLGVRLYKNSTQAQQPDESGQEQQYDGGKNAPDAPDTGQQYGNSDFVPDDGELHDGWNSNVSYSKSTESYTYQASGEAIAGYPEGAFDIDLNVEYPQLHGDIPNLDVVNGQIRDTAMLFVTNAYLAPNTDTFYGKLVQNTFEPDTRGIPEDGTRVLEDEVTYAVTYNTDDIISISFNDHYIGGTIYNEYLELRTININLKTGEVYTFDNTLTMTDDLAAEWVDNVNNRTSSSSTVKAYGRDETIAILTGRSDQSFRATPCMFIDANGKVNVGVSYWFNGDESGILVRGWWDVTPSEETLDAAKKPSTMWDVLPPQ